MIIRVVNAGKSSRNEDQATMQVVTLRRDSMTQHSICSPESQLNSPSSSLGFSLFKSGSCHPANNLVHAEPAAEANISGHVNIVNGDDDQGTVGFCFLLDAT